MLAEFLLPGPWVGGGIQPELPHWPTGQRGAGGATRCRPRFLLFWRRFLLLHRGSMKASCLSFLVDLAGQRGVAGADASAQAGGTRCRPRFFLVLHLQAAAPKVEVIGCRASSSWFTVPVPVPRGAARGSSCSSCGGATFAQRAFPAGSPRRRESSQSSPVPVRCHAVPPEVAPAPAAAAEAGPPLGSELPRR